MKIWSMTKRKDVKPEELPLDDLIDYLNHISIDVSEAWFPDTAKSEGYTSIKEAIRRLKNLENQTMYDKEEIESERFRNLFNYVLTSPAFVQFIFGFENKLELFFRPESPDSLFDNLKKRFEDCKIDNYKVNWKRIDDGDVGGDYVKFTVTREPKQDIIFLLHDFASESQCDESDTVSVFLTIEEARAELEDKANNYKHLKSFEMLEDEFTASCGDWFYRTWIETVPVKHRKVKNGQEADKGHD